MPTYAYKCPGCGKCWDHYQLMSDPPLAECPDCRTKPRRLMGCGSSVVFRGTGFYETDYKRPPRPARAVYEG